MQVQGAGVRATGGAGVCRSGRAEEPELMPVLVHGDLQRSRSKAGLPEHKGKTEEGP